MNFEADQKRETQQPPYTIWVFGLEEFGLMNRTGELGPWLS